MKNTREKNTKIENNNHKKYERSQTQTTHQPVEGLTPHGIMRPPPPYTPRYHITVIFERFEEGGTSFKPH